MSQLLRGSELISTEGGTATFKECLDVYRSFFFCCYGDWGIGVGTTGIPQVGARDALHLALLRMVLQAE
jgi:hypothetical protein